MITEFRGLRSARRRDISRSEIRDISRLEEAEMGEWTLSQPTVIEVDDAIHAVDVRVVSGHVDLVCGEGDGAHVEVTEIDGPPLRVTVDNGRLTIAHEDLHWPSLLGSGCGHGSGGAQSCP